MGMRHYYRWVRNNTRTDGAALDRAAAHFGFNGAMSRQNFDRIYGRKTKGLRARCPVTPRRRSGAADRIRTGDVQLGKLAFCH
jgi:hypothetical protein